MNGIGSRIGAALRAVAGRKGRPVPGGTFKTIELDYPIRPTPRYGRGKPPHRLLYEIIDRGRDGYARTLAGFLDLRDRLVRIPRTREPDTLDPCWVNVWIPGLDAVSLYGLVASRKPRRYLEIGSGHSTAIARRAVFDLGLETEIVSIDPHPRREIDRLCDRVIRRPLEEVDLDLFDELEPGDFLFVDSSHYCFMNSDVTVLFLDVLPRLRPGVVVHLHDVFLPYDYPSDVGASFLFYSEQYLLAVSLLANAEKHAILLPNAFISEDPELAQILAPLWREPALEGVFTTGGSFWFETR